MSVAEQTQPEIQKEVPKDNALVAAEKANTETNNMLFVAESYVIDCADMAEAAADDMNAAVQKAKELNELRLTMTRPLDESKKRIMDLFREPIAVAEKAANTLKNAIGQWHIKEQVRLAEIARKEEAERRAQEELVRAEAQKLEQAKAEAEASGDTEKAEELEQQAMEANHAADSITYYAPVAAPTKTVKGASIRKNWKAEVTDLMALVKAVAEGKASIELLSADMKAINKRAKALEAEFKVPGIRVYNESVVAAKRSR